MGLVKILLLSSAMLLFILAPHNHASTVTEEDCGENEEFVTCHSSTCFDMTCEYLNTPRRCTRDCQRGCACIRDYVRAEDGKCYHQSICNEASAEEEEQEGM